MYISGREAIDRKIITEEHWEQAIRFPWTWVVVSPTVRVREIPWNGLQVEAKDN